MKHKPFEEWIFSEEQPEKEDSKALYDHLRDCDECYLLEKRWRQIEPLLVAAPVTGPANGFAQRWQARLALNRRRATQRQNLGVLAATSVSAGVFLFLFIAQFYRQIAGVLSPVVLWFSSALQVVSIVLTPVGDVYQLFMHHSPATFSMLLVMAFFAASGIFAIAWLKMFRTLARVQGMTKWA